MTEPERKRARVDDGQDGSDEPWVKDPAKYVNANDIVRLRFLGPTSDDSARHAPEFTHQIYPPLGAIACAEEERPLGLEVCYAASNLELFYQLAGGSTELHGAAEDAIFTLAAAMPQPAASLAELGAVPELTSPALSALGGELRATYTLDGQPPSFEVYVAPLGAEAPAERLRFHERLQTLFRFYIETSEAIDASDERWRLLSVFERDAGGAVRLVAACTLFRFSRWVGGKGAVSLLRLCQVVTLPPFRAKGHGGRLLDEVYRYAHAMGALEVTVEDPNDQMRFLRDLADVRGCIRDDLLTPADVSAGAPSAEAMEAARATLPLTDEQLLRTHEMRTHRLLLVAEAALDADGCEALRKPFRLRVKARLNKKYKEELDAMLSVAQLPSEQTQQEDTAPPPSRAELVEERKKRLHELYMQTLAEYDAVLRRVALSA